VVMQFQSSPAGGGNGPTKTQLTGGQEDLESKWIKEKEEPDSILVVEVKEETDSSSWIKHEQQKLEHFPTGQDQKDGGSSEEGEQLVQEQTVALMETPLQEDGEQLQPVSPLQTPRHQGSEPNAEECQNYSSLTCDVCGKTFKSKYNSQVHHRMHLGLKPFVCTICGKGFSQKTHLKGHISVHTGEWPFYCKICGRGCVDRRRLNNHMRTHCGEKSFTCEICGIGFTLLSSLNSHLRKHNRETLFSCPTCGQIFTRKISLRAHMWVHTGEKPFSCTECGVKFSTANGMYRHKKSHKDEETNLVTAGSASVCW
uniref:C2H2-type domain-containing protein n=1 Tax=Poecilia reticulata TaxID=8081 RepID=A0A3P9N663_POERE